MKTTMSTRALALMTILLSTGCLGLSEQDEKRFTLHQRNSQEFYNKGSYVQAVQQAEMALSFDEDSEGMRLMRGYCLTKLGETRNEVVLLDEAIRTLEDLRGTASDKNYRVWLGIGQAHLARAMLSDGEIGRIQWQLSSEFLDDEGRQAESRKLVAERTGRKKHLSEAEHALKKVLDFDLQADNTYALIELALVLNLQGERETEALDYSARAVEQLMQSNQVTNNTLQETHNLSPSFELSLERRIEDNLQKERQLRDAMAHIHYSLGDHEAALEAINGIEQRQLMQAGHYEFRATLHELLLMLDEAVSDLETFLKLRAQNVDFDDVASQTFDRIDKLVGRGATRPVKS